MSIPYTEPGPDASSKWMSLFEAIFHSGVVCDAARDKGYISSPLWESQNSDGLSELFQIRARKLSLYSPTLISDWTQAASRSYMNLDKEVLSS